MLLYFRHCVSIFALLPSLCFGLCPTFGLWRVESFRRHAVCTGSYALNLVEPMCILCLLLKLSWSKFIMSANNKQMIPGTSCWNKWRCRRRARRTHARVAHGVVVVGYLLCPSPCMLQRRRYNIYKFAKTEKIYIIFLVWSPSSILTTAKLAHILASMAH